MDTDRDVKRGQSGDNWRRVHGGKWSTDSLRASCPGNVTPGSGTSELSQTSRDRAPAGREAAAAHWTSLWLVCHYYN